MPKSFPGHELLPRSSLLSLTEVQQRGADWIVMADGRSHAACPRCGRVSRSRQSAYTRTLRDLPALGATVWLRIRVARWR